MDRSEFLEKIYDKLEKLAEEISELKIISAKHDTNLELHMKRSDTLEKEVKILEDSFNTRINPIEDHVKSVNLYMKIATGFVSLASTVIAFIELFKFFK